MAENVDNPFGEPMSMQEALERADSLTRAKEAEPTQPPQEAEPELDETADAVEDDAEEIQDAEPEDDGTQVLTADEYGDVLVAVGDEQVALSELINGNLRQQDYTRKTQSAAEERKRLEAEFSDREKALAAREQQLAAQLAELEPQEPDWEKLAEDDPLGWPAEKAKWDKAQAKRKAMQEQAQQQQQQQMLEFKRLTSEKAIEAIPEWGEPGKFQENVEARRAAALQAGFTAEEYNSAVDMRLAVLLEKAARYDAMQKDGSAKKAALDKKLAKAPKVLKPGQSRGDSDPAAERRAAIQKRLSKPITSRELKGLIGRA